MNNPDPYRPPASKLDVTETSTTPRRFGGLFWLTAGGAAFFSLMLAIIGTFVAPVFKQMFNAMRGGDLPWTTTIVLSIHYLWWIAPGIAAGLWTYSLWAPARLQYRTRLMLAFAVLAIGSMAMMTFTLVALYEPMFSMGEAV